jgi:hypothetical protein
MNVCPRLGCGPPLTAKAALRLTAAGRG